jgi:hypothetical protein
LHAVCSVAYEKDFVDKARWVSCEGGPEQFSGVISVKEWYVRDSIDRKDRRGIYRAVDIVIVGHDGFIDLVGSVIKRGGEKSACRGIG